MVRWSQHARGRAFRCRKTSKVCAKALRSEQAQLVWGMAFITIILGARYIYPHLRDGKTETQGDEVDNSHPT